MPPAISPQDWACALEQARTQARPVEQLTASRPDLSLEDAYRIQDEGIRLRQAAGDAALGFKMGLTSKAKMKQMGVDTPIMGVLTRTMRLGSGETFGLAGLIHPRIEPEIAFFVARELRGAVTADQALDACSGACAALEIVDSRFRDFKFTLPDVVADNCSSCAFALGKTVVEPRRVALGALRMDMAIDGKIVQTGSSAEILGHPAASLAELSKMLAARGRSIPAGSVVLAGAATAAVALTPGASVSLAVEGLGGVEVRVSA